ncbi:MAG: DUF1385 domain-containing protein [Candidatus Bathyarchaeota archaeon]
MAKKREESSLAFGGQALIEGVMMRSRRHMVICVRQPTNEIMTHTEKINSVSEKYRVLRVPFLRGIIALIETFYLGFKGLQFSANAVLDEDEEFTLAEFGIVVVLALGLTSFFFVVPFLLTNLLNLTGLAFNIIEAIVRLGIFLLYLSLIALWGEYRRVLQYHGAEHKTINAHEAGVELNIANIKKFSRFHPRCGTSFIFIVIIISILLFSIMPNLGFAVRIAYRILLIPVIGTISYEILKLSGKYRNSIIMKILTKPGLAFQRLTTREPSEDMIEVAMEAVKEIKREIEPT